MLTLFAVPKAFAGPIGCIQRNAILSWKHSQPGCEILLFGDEAGVEGAAKDTGSRHLSQVKKNKFSTPRVDDVFAKAQALASNDFLCYVNADILFLDDLSELVSVVPFRNFLLVGRRWDLERPGEIDFSRGDWREGVKSAVEERGRLHAATGVDYFLFRRGLYPTIPPFAIGRTAWDNWLICEARRRGVAVIDGTKRISAVHQNHEYAASLVSGSGYWKGQEAQENLRLAGDLDYCFTIEDAEWSWGPSGLKSRRWSPVRMGRQLSAFPVLYEHHPWLGWAARPMLKIRGLARQAVRAGREKVRAEKLP